MYATFTADWRFIRFIHSFVRVYRSVSRLLDDLDTRVLAERISNIVILRLQAMLHVHVYTHV